MSDLPLHVVHVSPRVQGQGGIETLQEVHRRLPVAQTFVALFDRQPEARPDYRNLAFTWRTPLRRMRRRFGQALSDRAGGVVIYHNGWGLPLFHDLDRAARRLVFLHAHAAYHAPDLPGFAGLIDGAAAVGPDWGEAWARVMPDLSPPRTARLRVPVEAPPIERGPRPAGQPITLGFAGRIERVHKRLDRLPALLRALDAAGFPCRFELLGDGALRPHLERQLGSRVRFHGWRPREDFWRVLADWDGMVLFSDGEGGPIALFEGMALGVLPFWPAIGGSWGDAYVPQIDPRCHYPPGDMPALARSIREVFRSPAEDLEAMRGRARRLVADRTTEAYGTDFTAWVRVIVERPPVSRGGPRRPRFTDLLPLGLVTRLAPWALRRR